jgi:AcrR family transcriptional regulator
VDQIVAAAIAVADREGLSAMSMVRVAEEIGAGTMSLYTYVPGKGELIDLMYDRALAELPTGYDLTVGWRAAATAWARDLWDFHLRHPWTLQMSHSRPVLGPGEFAMAETMTRVLRTTGLDARTLRHVGGTLVYFVRDAARTITESRQATAETGLSEEKWWYARSAMLEEIVPDFGERYPTLTWMESRGAYEPLDETTPYLEQEATETFEAGLAVILDGVEAAMRRAGTEGAAIDVERTSGETLGR